MGPYRTPGSEPIPRIDQRPFAKRLMEQIVTGPTYLRGEIGRRLEAEGGSVVCTIEIDGKKYAAFILGYCEETPDRYRVNYKRNGDDVVGEMAVIALDQVKSLC